MTGGGDRRRDDGRTPVPAGQRARSPGSRARGRADRGGTTTFVVLLVVPVLLMAGLAVDGGLLLTERRAALDAARTAALAGAGAVDVPQARQGVVVLDPSAARQVAAESLEASGYQGTVEVRPAGAPTEVVVMAERQVELQLLPLIGLTTRTVTATGVARISRGVDAADD